ncbi:hypothetical protein CEXT_777531 [Caerostris extrusa]|uniref:Uncharacterized protein n=1 Tax=Caerostris extrusa TaxID=172846 RepID=A0AAV4RCU0_CAEEX|nr:hypothetical protein CEXT_777531 [Caerostris extrusa]
MWNCIAPAAHFRQSSLRETAGKYPKPLLRLAHFCLPVMGPSREKEAPARFIREMLLQCTPLHETPPPIVILWLREFFSGNEEFLLSELEV